MRGNRRLDTKATQPGQFQWDPLSAMQWASREAHLLYDQAVQDEDIPAQMLILNEIKLQTKFIDELLAGAPPDLAQKLEDEWVLVRATIFQVLESYPEAKRAVSESLSKLGR